VTREGRGGIRWWGGPRASALGAAAGGPARPVGSAPTPRVDGGTPVGSCAAVGRPGCRPSGSPPPRQPSKTRIYTRCIGTGVVGLLWAPGEQTAGSRVDHETAAVQRGCGAGGWITISARGGSEGGRRQRPGGTQRKTRSTAPRRVLTQELQVQELQRDPTLAQLQRHPPRVGPRPLRPRHSIHRRIAPSPSTPRCSTPCTGRLTHGGSKSLVPVAPQASPFRQGNPS
jgi:hypothetical protein